MDGLEPAQEKAALFLAEGMKAADIARRLEISPQTIWRWKKNKLFQLRLAQLMQDATAEAMDTLKNNVTGAVDTIVDISSGNYEDEKDARIRFAAAKWIAERVLNPASKEGAAPHEAAKKAREVAVEVERLTGDDIGDLLSRGT